MERLRSGDVHSCPRVGERGHRGGQAHRYGRPQRHPTDQRWMLDAPQDQLLIGELGPVVVEAVGTVAAILPPQRAAAVRMVAGDEAVVAPHGEAPVLVQIGVTAPQPRTPYTGPV